MSGRPTLSMTLARVLAHGLEQPRVAYAATKATIRAIGERLPDKEAEAFGRLLPEELEGVVERGEYTGDFDSDELIRRVARATHVSEVTASAHVEVVMRALGDTLDSAALVHLAHVLPERVAHGLLGYPM